MLSARYQDSWGAEGTFDLLTDIQAISLPPLELHPMQANAPFALTKARLPAGAKTPMASHWAICHPMKVQRASQPTFCPTNPQNKD